MIDWKMVEAIPDARQVEAEARATRVKAECEAVIKAVFDSNTAINLLLAAQLGTMPAAEQAAMVSGEKWKNSMIAECRRAIAAGDDATWPDLPDDAAALARKY